MVVRPRLQQVKLRSREVRTPGPRWDGVERIWIARTDKLGDLIVSLPAVAALARAYPAAKRCLLVHPRRLGFAAMVQGVDEILARPGHHHELTAMMRRARPDLLVSIARDSGVAWSAARAGVPHRVGTGRRVYSSLFHRRVAESRRDERRHEVEYALSFAHRAGAAPGAAEFPIVAAEEPSARARAELRAHGIDGPFVVLHPGSGGSCPRWPIEHWVTLHRELIRLNVDVVLSLGPEDAEWSSSFPSAAPRYEGDAGGLVALIGRASAVVGSSTGPIHLAAAVGTPALSLHAPWDSCGVERWGPYATNGWALVATCDEALAWTRAERARRGTELLRAIDPASVSGCVRALAEGGTPALDHA